MTEEPGKSNMAPLFQSGAILILTGAPILIDRGMI